MKKLLSLFIIAISLLGLVGCGQTIYPDLPDNAVAFEMGEYVDTDDAAYGTIVYQGRTYMPYGTLGKTLREKDISCCIGYMIQDGKADTDERVYTLSDDTECNYLMEYYAAADNEMEQPYFWRAIDTRGKNITAPEYIDSLDYSYWN